MDKTEKAENTWFLLKDLCESRGIPAIFGVEIDDFVEWIISKDPLVELIHIDIVEKVFE